MTKEKQTKPASSLQPQTKKAETTSQPLIQTTTGVIQTISSTADPVKSTSDKPQMDPIDMESYLQDMQDANKALREELAGITRKSDTLQKVNEALSAELKSLKETHAKTSHDHETERANAAVLGSSTFKSVT